MENDRSNPLPESAISIALLSVLFLIAPLFPQNIHGSYAFFFRSSIFLLTGLAAYRLGAGEWIARLLGSPVFLPSMGILLWMLIGLFYSPDVYRAKEKWVLTLSAALLYGLALSTPASRRRTAFLLGCLAAGGALAAIHGLYAQWIGHGEEIEALRSSNLYPEDMRNEMIRALEANRALGRFGNPNQLAGYLALSIWPLWALVRQGKKFWKSALGWLAGLLLAFGIYRTYSRSGLLVLAFTAVLLLGYEFHRRGYRVSIKTAFVVLLSVCVLVTAGIAMLPPGFLGGRLMTVSTIVARMHFFRGASMIVARHPWFGVGPESFEAYYCEFIRPGDLEAHYVHNIVLESAVEGGVPGVFLLFWLTCAVLISFKRIWSVRPETRIIHFAALGSCLSLFLLSLADFHNNLAEMWMTPAFLLGLSHRNTGEAIFPRNSRRIATFILMGLAGVWIVFVLCRYWNDTARLDGRYLAFDGKKYEAREAYERAVLFDRTDAESWRQIGLLWAEIPNSVAQTRRLECLEKAVRWSPRRASVRADYADAFFALGYAEQALEEMLHAQRLFPARPVYYERAAAILRFLNRTEEAQEQVDKANEIKKAIETNRS